MKSFLVLFYALVLSHLAMAIHKGEPVENNEFTFVVGIKDCTAVFLNSKILVTAAHCVEETPKKTQIEIYPYSRQGSISVGGEIKIHKSRDKEFVNHDLALILLDKPYSELDKNFSLPIKKDVQLPIGEMTVVGMGAKSTPRKGSSFSIFPDKKSKTRYTPFNISEDVLQMNPLVDFSGVCLGDSGGGAFIFENGQYKLVSILAHMDSSTCGIKAHRLDTVMIDKNLCWIQEVSNVDFGKNCDAIGLATLPPTKE